MVYWSVIIEQSCCMFLIKVCRLSTNFINACNHKYLDSLQYCTYYICQCRIFMFSVDRIIDNGLTLILVLYNLMHGMYVGYCNLINLYIWLHAINHLGGFISSRWLLNTFFEFLRYHNLRACIMWSRAKGHQQRQFSFVMLYIYNEFLIFKESIRLPWGHIM